MIVVLGASGNTGSKTAGKLLEKGVRVRVVGRSREKLKAFEALGAEICVGDQSQPEFLTEAFTGAYGVYALIPPKMDSPDIRQYYNDSADNIVTAVKKTGLKKLVFLSSLGAELDTGTGPILGLHDAEEKLAELTDVDIVILRPGYFMENTLWNIPLIKGQNINGNPTSPEAPIYMVATQDISEKAAELLDGLKFTGYSIIDLYGDKITYAEVTRQIGEAVGQSGLPYIQFEDSDALEGLKQMGLSDSMASSYVELSHGVSDGKIKPTQLNGDGPNAKTRFKTFAEGVFAPAYAAG